MLQNFPTQKKDFILEIGSIDPSNSNTLVFNHENHTPQITTQLSFMILVVVHGKNIHRSIVDEGLSTFIMSMSF